MNCIKIEENVSWKRNYDNETKGQLISKQNCRAITSSKKQTLEFYF